MASFKYYNNELNWTKWQLKTEILKKPLLYIRLRMIILNYKCELWQLDNSRKNQEIWPITSRQRQIINKADIKARNKDHFWRKTSKYEDVHLITIFSIQKLDTTKSHSHYWKKMKNQQFTSYWTYFLKQT